ncbi:DNA topoisomerase (ATP-hydrolyzing) subunit B [Metamycoplasma equirhinis]|uniref:DNA gyrase subunit B n=3 Tax=Metamycoplasma equirhinis TaxID=92402 RepID=A0ABZ0PB09_9BACT|nr:DNA topoisomerase (ATP-hydrolyzing) subunit B [Metamycoplasma equirhinis]TPD99615.1 DNA topoisomerase (ATP-hydrolyzing) subunit B [Metamycoplasma equirhinis]WPB53937.1 DNA topoisomerase (ATP-hydrolyzing) subunit B [Metamycoplasma equirhinis]BDX52976.1 DNA gyrase subunit B [Metamycoplasma equirhinis]
MDKVDETKKYEASNIQVLEGLEAVRKRPGMYIGSIGFRGLHHLIWEIVDNSVDEAMAGYASKIDIILHSDNVIEIVDNGRGMPVDIHPKTHKSAVETILTVLHAGGKFDGSNYKVSGGLHGVGASVVNALSDKFEVWVKRDGKLYYQKFLNGGHSEKPLEVIGEVKNGETGTKIKFHPDFTIMDKLDFDYGTILDHSKQIAYLNKGLILNIKNNINNTSKTFHFDGGLIDYVNELNKGKKLINPEVIYAEGDFKDKIEGANDVIVEIAMQYNETFTSNVVSYANNIQTGDGGTHEQGFYDALTRIYHKYAEENKLYKNNTEKISREDVKDGLVAIISIKHTDPIFEGQTKGKLENKDARIATNKVISIQLEKYMGENPEVAKAIIEKCLLTQRSRLAANAAREASRKKDGLDIGNLPGKLADCSSKNAEVRELFIVEGNSAGGSAKMGRNRAIQAILPLRGKVINAEKNAFTTVLANKEIATMIHALGTGISEEFNINKLKYHKIIIMTDADVDGAHITTLLLTFFYRYMRPLIEYGFVYIAQPPLYKITSGKTVNYAYNDAQKEEILSRLDDKKNVGIQRYKGLGEMDPEQLWETTMDPETRKMLQVQIDDIAICDTVFSTLMGEEIEPRHDFIQENAKYASNIDF